MAESFKILYRVPEATLRRRVQDKNKIVQSKNKGLGRYQTKCDVNLKGRSLTKLNFMSHACLD